MGAEIVRMCGSMVEVETQKSGWEGGKGSGLMPEVETQKLGWEGGGKGSGR